MVLVKSDLKFHLALNDGRIFQLKLFFGEETQSNICGSVTGHQGPL